MFNFPNPAANGNWLWLGTVLLIVGLVLALGIWGILALRKWLKSPRSNGGSMFSLDQLSQMRDAGQISPEEYSTLRQQILNLSPRHLGKK